MPNLFDGSFITSSLSGTSLSNAPSTSGSSSGSGSCCCPSSTLFLESLTTKLIAMTTSLKQQFIDLQNNQKDVPGSSGLRLLEIGISERVSVKQEYVIYLKRYGPPLQGNFDPQRLAIIRAQIATGVFIDSDSDSDSSSD